MKTSLIPLIFFLFLLNHTTLSAQHHGHYHNRNEIGISSGVIYAFDHETTGGGVHLHYYRTLGDHSKWSVGGMVERAWAHGGHTTLGAGAKYQLTERFGIGIMPGVTFLKHEEHFHHGDHVHSDSENKTKFSAHIELVYDLLHWDFLHLGPVLDYSWSKDDSHMMLGLHVAWSF